MDQTLLLSGELPEGFQYPPDFLRFVDMDITYLEPWFLLTGDRLRERFNGMAERYPDRCLVPFARREDNDDVACWEVAGDGVVIIHDFASPGWESKGNRGFPDFAAWLHSAIDEMLEFR